MSGGVAIRDAAATVTAGENIGFVIGQEYLIEISGTVSGETIIQMLQNLA